MIGRINSIETMGLVDGPGIRTVVFLQGCNLRCLYCHNPDTWSKDGGYEISANDLLKKILRFKVYYARNNGGVTFSGGEPLLQKDFLLEMLQLCKKENINTCLDTAGCGIGNYDEILKYIDLVIYDVKHFTKDGYKKITKMELNETLNFLDAVQRNEKRLWIRHVVVPKITDSEEHIKKLSQYITQIKNVDRIELLPYHLMGLEKYKSLNIEYPLNGCPKMDETKTYNYQKLFF